MTKTLPGEGLENIPWGYLSSLWRSLAMGEYIHPELNKRVDSFGGGYSFIEERKFPYRGREVLFSVGIANLEASCCGSWGCGFIKVPGYVLSWKTRVEKEGQVLSEIERVEDQESQREIRRILEEKFPGFSQIEFL